MLLAKLLVTALRTVAILVVCPVEASFLHLLGMVVELRHVRQVGRGICVLLEVTSVAEFGRCLAVLCFVSGDVRFALVSRVA